MARKTGSLALAIAARNVARHGRRTAITVVVMVFGIAMFAVADGVLKGMDRITIDTMTTVSASYMKIRSPDYVEEELALPLAYGVEDWPAVAEAVRRADPRVIDVAPRTRFQAMASNRADALPALAVAVDPARDPRVFSLVDFVEGAWLSGAPGEVVVGSELASELGLAVGDDVVLQAKTVDEKDENGETVSGSNAAVCRIVGISRTPDPSLNKLGVHLSLADAAELTGMGDLVTELCVRMPRGASLQGDIDSAAELARSLAGIRPDLAFTPIGVLAGDYLAMREMKGKGSFVIIFVILLIAAVGIVNTVLMSLYSRIREVGVLRAYGLTAKDVTRVFLAEGLVIGAIGSALGAVVGALATWYMVEFGIPMEAMFGKLDLGNIPIAEALKAEWSPQTFVVAIVFGMVVSLVASWIPARRAGKLEPADALKFV